MSRHLIRAADELDSIDAAAIDAAVLKVDRKPETEPAPITPKPTPAPAPHRAVAAAPRPAARTPLDLATTISPGQILRRQESVLAYSASTGTVAQVLPAYTDHGTDEHDQLVDEVVALVIASFRKSASSQDKLELQRARPSISRDVDRALLQDASDLMQVYDLDEGIRHQLRTRFWDIYDKD